MRKYNFYKIYFNNKCVNLVENITQEMRSENNIIVPFTGKKSIEPIIEAAHKNEFQSEVFIHSHDLEYLKKTIHSCFKNIEAAGGLVVNDNEELLLIHRNGLWDLPKGKLEKGESIEEGALREVIEETAIENLEMHKPFKFPFLNENKTFHSYSHKGKLILKTTFWFYMKSNFTGKLIPQTEEGITEVCWSSLESASAKLAKSYKSLQDLMKY